MNYQTNILKASTVIASHIGRMKVSKYKSVVASGMDFERFYDKVLQVTADADEWKKLYSGLLYFKSKEIDILKENYLKDLDWFTGAYVKLGGSMDDILKNISHDILEGNHNKVQEEKHQS